VIWVYCFKLEFRDIIAEILQLEVPFFLDT